MNNFTPRFFFFLSMMPFCFPLFLHSHPPILTYFLIITNKILPSPSPPSSKFLIFFFLLIISPSFPYHHTGLSKKDQSEGFGNRCGKKTFLFSFCLPLSLSLSLFLFLSPLPSLLPLCEFFLRSRKKRASFSKMTEYIDLDLDGIGDSPIISQTPRYPGVKAEVTTRVDADMAFTDFNFTLPKAPVREPPAPSKTPPPPSEALPPPSNYPPTPRVVFSYHAPTSIHLGPTRVTTLPSFDCFGRDMVRETRGNWSDHLFKSPSSVFSLGRRPQSRPPLEGVLSKARENAKQISVPKALVGVRVVPSSAASVVMTVHSLMLSMLNGSFTMEQAACDFLLLSMIRAEVSLGVYSTPPQLVLQTRRRLTYLNNPRHKEEGEMVMRRLERLLKVWRAHWRPRPFSGCHGSIEGLKDKEEDKQISDKMQGDV